MCGHRAGPVTSMNENLLIAVIAAGAALLGAVAGQFGPVVQHWLSARHERRALLRQEYEQMAMLVAEVSVHLSRILPAATSDDPPPEDHALFQASLQMHMLALLYFPDVLPAMERYRDAANGLALSLQGGSSAETQRSHTRREFVQARAQLLDQLRERASKYAA